MNAVDWMRWHDLSSEARAAIELETEELFWLHVLHELRKSQANQTWGRLRAVRLLPFRNPIGVQ